MNTIRDVEEQVQTEVCPLLKRLGLLPDGYVCSVRLYGESRKKRQTAPFQKNWHPETDSIEIQFEPAPAVRQVQPPGERPAPQAAMAAAAPPDPVADLVQALARVEARRGLNFVALKWFRDTVLPSEAYSWASSDAARKSVLGEAIEERLVLTSSIPNPKSPYPTTTVRLNRLMPRVQAILGVRGGPGPKPDFAPVPIRGENLSDTVLRDRR